MKYIAFLLALVIQITSCIPCGDATECIAVVNTNEATSHHTDHDDHQESCSPFCACACCATIAGFVLSTYPIISLPIKINLPVQYQLGKVQFLSHHDQSIWQPPQLS